MKKVLENIRVLDITRYVAGPICSAQLADLGAEVIRVENVGGAEDRSPLPVDPEYPGGAGFLQVNRNKKGLSLDMSCDRGQEILEKLVASADIVVANLPGKAARELKIDYDSLRHIRPDIIFVHITSFGNEGPYAERTGFDAIAQVMSGATYLSGWPGQPMKNIAPWVDMTAGNHATTGCLAALLHRNATGEGQKVEVNLLQSALTLTNYFLLEEELTGIGRTGIGNRAPSGGPADLIPTSDGAVYIAVLGNRMFERLAKMIGHPELTDDPRFARDDLRAENGEILSEMVSAWAAGKTTTQLLDILEKHRIPAGPLLKPGEILRDVHVQSAGFVTNLEVPGLAAPVPYINPPYRMSESPASIESGPPTPGEHNDAILGELGYSADQLEELRARSVI